MADVCKAYPGGWTPSKALIEYGYIDPDTPGNDRFLLDLMALGKQNERDRADMEEREKKRPKEGAKKRLSGKQVNAMLAKINGKPD